MLYYDGIDVSERIDFGKTSPSKARVIYHYSYFLCYSFKFQPNVCSRYQNLLMTYIKLSNIAILNNKGSDSCCMLSLISKNEALNW